MRATAWDLDLRADGAPLVTGLTFDARSGLFSTTLRNDGPGPVRVSALRLRADLAESAAGGSFWIHGRYMQKDTLIRNLGGPPPGDYLGEYLDRRADGPCYLSRGVATLTLPHRSPPVLLVGALHLDRFFFDVELGTDESESLLRSLVLVFDLEGQEIHPGETLALPPLLLRTGEDPRELVEAWADLVAQKMRARVPEWIPTGWCSWYYFYNKVSEADVRANLETMTRERHPAEVVQIDDGFQSATGDWLTPNERFPGGMGPLARAIDAAGFKPGLWLAPLVMHESSALLRDHPEMALKTRDGATHFVEIWLGRCAVLDVTHPASEAWLRQVIRTAVREWGYVYLKLDALAFAAASAEAVSYHRPITGPAHLRRGLSIIREEAGEETFILGCTCHFGSAIGLVDAMRVGPDVKELWADGPRPSVRHAMRNTLQRNFMHRRFWVNDPDCLIVRDTNTALTEAEVRFLGTGIALSGGMVVLSDDLPRLSPTRRRMALALLPPVGQAARPQNPAEGPVSTTWRTELGEGRALVGLLNWGDAPLVRERRSFLAPDEVAFDFWNARLLVGETLTLQPHEGVLLQVTAPGAAPRVVGDTGHAAGAGLRVTRETQALTLENALDRPRTVAVDLGESSTSRVELGPGEVQRLVID